MPNKTHPCPDCGEELIVIENRKEYCSSKNCNYEEFLFDFEDEEPAKTRTRVQRLARAEP